MYPVSSVFGSHEPVAWCCAPFFQSGNHGDTDVTLGLPHLLLLHKLFVQQFFFLADCSQTIYILIELQVKGESQKLLLSDTFVAAQTFSADKFLVTRLALQSTHRSVLSDHAESSVDRRQADHTCVPSVLVHSSATHQHWWWTAVSLPLIFGFDLCCAWMIRASLRCFQTKHVFMGLEKRFDRAQSHRFSAYYGFTERLHLAHLFICLAT